MRCLELFAGIGGFAAAFPHLYIVQAVDIDQHAGQVYRHNFFHPYWNAEIASIPAKWFADHEAHAWWMSPPCTPFTRRGNAQGLDDPRCAAFRHLIDVVAEVQPPIVAIENVVGFERSDAFHLLNRRWSAAGYKIDWSIACPSELGWPNRRPRVYVLATQPPHFRLNRHFDLDETKFPLESYLDPDYSIEFGAAELFLEDAVAAQYYAALDRVRREDPNALTACFTSSYGRSILKAGSYLREDTRLRRFSPREVARLLGFPRSFQFPPELGLKRLWHLLGNSLSLPTVRHAFKNVFSRGAIEENWPEMGPLES